jgi:radical SAM superfamily enzyme YgiQ (UPF0313 family)
LEKHDYSVKILDLCFSSSPIKDLKNQLEAESFDIVGFTIRNIDTSNYFNNEFFLPSIKELVKIVKEHSIPVILGGSGFSAMPEEILEYLQGDYGIIGPGEVAFPRFLELWKSNKLNKKIIDGWEYGINNELIHKRAEKINYSDYLSQGGIIGFETHVGCDNKCPYCIEANTKVKFKAIPTIINELKHLTTQGYNHFHTCDTEFNTNLKFAIDFCQALIKEKINIKWVLYMRPYPYNKELYDLLAKSGAYLITLSVDSDEKLQSENHYTYQDLEKIIKYCKEYNIKLAIDTLIGFPGETEDSIRKMISFFKINRPSRVGISLHYRIYKNTKIANMIKNNTTFQKYLNKDYIDKMDFLEPVFYYQSIQELIEKLIAGDELFDFAGKRAGVNYQLTK